MYYNISVKTRSCIYFDEHKNNENIDFADEKEHIAAVRAEAKRSFSLTGIALTVILVITTALQYLLAVAVRHFTKTAAPLPLHRGVHGS